MKTRPLIVILTLLCFVIACKSSSQHGNAPLWKQLILEPEKTHKNWGGERKCLNSSPFRYATPEHVNRMMAVLNCAYTKANGKGYKVARSFFEAKKPVIIELKLDTPQPMNAQTVASVLGANPGIAEKFIGIRRARVGGHAKHIWRNLPAELTQQKIYRVDAIPTRSDGSKTAYLILYIQSSPQVMKMLSTYNGDLRGVNQHGILPALSYGTGVDDPKTVVLNQSQLLVEPAFGAWADEPKVLSSRSALKSALDTKTLPESAATALSGIIKSAQREKQLLQQSYEAKLYLATTRGESMAVVAPLLYTLAVTTGHRVGMLVRLGKVPSLGPVGVKHFYTYPTSQKVERKTPRLYIDLTSQGIALSHELNVNDTLERRVLPPSKGCKTMGQTICTSLDPTKLGVLIEKVKVLDQGLKTFGTKEGQVANQWYQQIYESYDWAALRQTLKTLHQQYPDLEPIVRTAPNTPVGLTFYLIGQIGKIDPSKPMMNKNVLYEVMHIGLIP